MTSENKKYRSYKIDFSTVVNPALTYYSGSTTVTAADDEDAMEQARIKIARDLGRKTSDIRIVACHIIL